VSQCYGDVDAQDTQAVNLPKASDRIGKGKAFFADHREGKTMA
jgi:hypothetical protein